MRSDIYRKSPTRKAETRNSNYKPSPAAKPGRKEGYSMQVTLNTRVPIDIAKALDDYAQASGKSKAAIVAEALQKYLDRHQLPEKETTMTLRQFLVDVLGNDYAEFLDGGELELIQNDLDEPIERRFVADDNNYQATAVLAGNTLYVDLKANHFVHGEDDIIALLDGEMYGDNWIEV